MEVEIHHHFQISKRQRAIFLFFCRNGQNKKSEKGNRPTGVLMSKNNTVMHTFSKTKYKTVIT